ncbi:MAG TPA: ATP-binding protein [Thermoanaerobaculia bacterium]
MSVTSITARLPRVEDRLVLQKKIVENLPSAILVFDLETLVLVDHNNAASELEGKAFREPRFESLIGHTAAEIFPAFEDTIGPLFRGAIETGAVSSNEKMRIGNDPSREIFVSAAVKAMRAGGETTHLMVSLVDVTEKIAAREHQQALQRMESVGTLAGGLAHDVNNILAVIIGNADLLRANAPPHPVLQDSLDAIEKAAEAARRWTSQLLTFAKGGSSERRPVDLNEAVRGTLRLAASALGHDVAVATELEPSLPSAFADAGGVQQILVNLLVNARDAMDKKGRITVRTRRDHPWVQLDVDDSGPGVPETIRPRIFDPFFSTKKERGTGLGLSVVYGLVKSYEGQVTVSSSPLGGARFRVLLPIS